MSLNEGQNRAPELDQTRLRLAVDEGILTDAQADRLAEFWPHAGGNRDPLEINHVDAEEVRFARGFHDVFITMGIGILLLGLVYGLQSVASAKIAAFGGAAAVWVLSEIFAKKMRLALPSFVLTVTFTPMFLVACMLGLSGPDRHGDDVLANKDSIALLLPAVVTLAGAALHYWRFKVPVGLTGVTGAGLFLVALAIDVASPGSLERNLVVFALLAGLASFATAMVFDSRDLQRMTVNSDKAFWLHLMAAPLLMHSVFQLVTGGNSVEGAGNSILVIGFFLALAFVAIVVDRRALLVSGLSYFGFAIASLMNTAEISNEASFTVTLVLLGCFILLLGSAWRSVRRLLLTPFASSALMRFVPAVG
ncbi:hypothetical protein [Roseibium sediminis]|uniref:hypothetical protein n=1 Tax=Roseibium sediminis TaxID=1775174 RepID=UPI00123DF200|nr:hypothetical protein [Roseibium sediminis]